MSRKSFVHVPAALLPPEKIDLVLEELELVLASPLFRGSRRCQSLLRQITTLSLAHDMDSLKERALGIEVFGRAADYDTSQYPVVRATAAEIRKKLAQYYIEAGHELETRIELLAGSYCAEFHFVADPEAAPGAPVAPLEATPPHRKPVPLVVWAVTALVTVAIAVFAALTWPHSEIDDLWAPVLRAPGPVLVCVGLQAAYNLRSAEAQDAIQGILHEPSGTPARPVRESDLVLLRDRYVALDDVRCLVRITALLENHSKPYRVRGGVYTTFADLRDAPAVLIGAFDNPWSLRAAGHLRFTFIKDSAHDVGMVRDSQHPENSQWKLSNYWPDWDVTMDYAIVTRMSDSTTDHPVLIAAGLTQYGTIGAGEFATRPEYFAEAVKLLPANWQKKNLQIVLSVPVVNRISGRPRILATHVW